MRTAMATEGLKMRHPAASVQPISIQEKKAEQKKMAEQQHPGGAIKHGFWDQALRMLLFFLYFNGSCIA